MNITFSEARTLLHGTILTAQVIIKDEPVVFKITPDLFCRHWYEASYQKGDEIKVLARYIDDLEAAKALCAKKLNELTY